MNKLLAYRKLDAALGQTESVLRLAHRQIPATLAGRIDAALRFKPSGLRTDALKKTQI
jgi:hypothetical protein